MGKITLEAAFDYDFLLLALVTPLRDYRVGWYLNKIFGLDFKKGKDLELNIPAKNKMLYFSLLTSYSELDKVFIHLVGNKYYKDSLIPEFRQADYFIMLKGDESWSYSEKLMHELKKHNFVQTIFEVNHYSLNSKQNLVIDESNL